MVLQGVVNFIDFRDSCREGTRVTEILAHPVKKFMATKLDYILYKVVISFDFFLYKYYL